LHQKKQNFQRRLFYAPVSSEDNAVIENSKDSVTNNDSNTTSKLPIGMNSIVVLSNREAFQSLGVI
jgi:hypothetical protein